MLVALFVGLGISIAVSAAMLLVLAILTNRRIGNLFELGQMLPATLGLLARLARDVEVPRRVRWRLGFAFAYNVQPFVNVIPDFVPVLGFMDNVVVTGWALRSALRLSDPEAVARNWKGNPAGLGTLYAALRITPPKARPVN